MTYKYNKLLELGRYSIGQLNSLKPLNPVVAEIQGLLIEKTDGLNNLIVKKGQETTERDLSRINLETVSKMMLKVLRWSSNDFDKFANPIEQISEKTAKERMTLVDNIFPQSWYESLTSPVAIRVFADNALKKLQDFPDQQSIKILNENIQKTYTEFEITFQNYLKENGDVIKVQSELENAKDKMWNCYLGAKEIISGLLRINNRANELKLYFLDSDPSWKARNLYLSTESDNTETNKSTNSQTEENNQSKKD